MIKGEDDRLHEDDNEANGKRRRVQRACDVSRFPFLVVLLPLLTASSPFTGLS
jgi:hypothetical protein